MPPQWLSWSLQNAATGCSSSWPAEAQLQPSVASAALSQAPDQSTPAQSEGDQQSRTAAPATEASAANVVPSTTGRQASARHALPARPESSGLMSGIPEPQGSHLKFDLETDTQVQLAGSPFQWCKASEQSSCSTPLNGADSFPGPAVAPCHADEFSRQQGSDCALEPGTPLDEQSSLRPTSHDPYAAQNACDTPAVPEQESKSDSEEQHWQFDTEAAKQAVQGIMSSTVSATEGAQQELALSNISATCPLPTSGALQQLTDVPETVPLSATMPDAANALGTALEGMQYGDPMEVTSEGCGIMFNSLSNQLQSKRELPRKLWKYWLQVHVTVLLWMLPCCTQ